MLLTTVHWKCIEWWRLLHGDCTVGGLETETLCKKECKNKKNIYLFNSRWWLGTWLLLGGSTVPHTKLFQPLRHPNFFGLCCYKMHHRKNSQTLKARQTKSICAVTMKLGQNLCQTHTNTQNKLQVAAIFRDIAIRILVMVHFCESKLYWNCT
jgi:hypothetical protein